jgi:hypothetical protein
MLLAPTLLLNAGSGAAIARPTFSRDFAGEKTLNNGTGPAITFTRASNATFFDASGVLQTASNDAPRFDHDPATGASRGLLIEEARTNSIRNSQAGGSTNGVIGSGGALPTNWSTGNLNANGLTNEVVGTGIEDGIAYLDYKVSGTPTATSQGFINYEASSAIAASSGQTWTNSCYVKLSGGSLNNVGSVALTIFERNSSDTNLNSSAQTFTPTSGNLRTQRQSLTRTLTEATTARLLASVRIAYTSGNPIDLTLRIAAPQLEQGAFATSYIPTTSAAATRAADSAVVTPISSFYNQSEGTLFAEVSVLTTASGTFPYSIALDDNTNNNRIELYGSTIDSVAVTASSGSQQTLISFAGAITAGTRFRTIVAARADDIAFSTNGQPVLTDATASMPVGVTQLRVKPNTFAHIRKIAYWPRRLSNTLLQQLTT